MLTYNDKLDITVHRDGDIGIRLTYGCISILLDLQQATRLQLSVLNLVERAQAVDRETWLDVVHKRRLRTSKGRGSTRTPKKRKSRSTKRP